MGGILLLRISNGVLKVLNGYNVVVLLGEPHLQRSIESCAYNGATYNPADSASPTEY